jgi:hypothetical protein
MDRFSLKFCTAIEWPAPISMWPRCCSSAFIGTTKNPAQAPISTSSATASQWSLTKIISGTMQPIAMPSGITRTEPRSVTMRRGHDRRRRRCRRPPRPEVWMPCDRSQVPSARSAQSITMNCSVAPAPQKSVVTASEIWPSLSFHSSREAVAEIGKQVARVAACSGLRSVRRCPAP